MWRHLHRRLRRVRHTSEKWCLSKESHVPLYHSVAERQPIGNNIYILPTGREFHLRVRLFGGNYCLSSLHGHLFQYKNYLSQIYEGATEEDPIVGRWCGDRLPPKYESTGNVLLIVFKSDWSAQREGFRIVYDTRRISCWFIHYFSIRLKILPCFIYIQCVAVSSHRKLALCPRQCTRKNMKSAERAII